MKKKNSLVILGIAAIVAVTGFGLLFSDRGTIIGVPVALAGDDDSGTFFAVLGGGQVVSVPPIGPSAAGSAIGTALITFSESTNLLCYTISYTGFVGVETAAHFHAPAYRTCRMPGRSWTGRQLN